MKFPQILLIVLFSAWGSAQADETSFCGRSLGQKVIDYVELPCPKDLACFGVWIRREMEVEKLLGGPPVGNQITVARTQHGLFNPEFDASFSLFTVRPIDDKAKRESLGADFVLVKFAKGEEAQACGNSPEKGAMYG
jgi:hypothetical protein